MLFLAKLYLGIFFPGHILIQLMGSDDRHCGITHKLSLTVRGSTLESDVCRRQILTTKDDSRTERNKQFITAVDP